MTLYEMIDTIMVKDNEYINEAKEFDGNAGIFAIT